MGPIPSYNNKIIKLYFQKYTTEISIKGKVNFLTLNKII